jgi:phage terminase small subunit
MTVKQKLFIKKYVESKGNATEAAMQAYDVKDRVVAAQVGHENLRKPEILAVLANHDIDAQNVFADALRAERKVYRKNKKTGKEEVVRAEPMHEIRLRAAESILDRLHGKAAQRTESVSASFVHHTSDKAKQYNLDQ